MSLNVQIVLAEDHVLVREGLRMLLSKVPGLAVVAETGDGAAVEELVRRTQPQLLLLDMGLPGRSGVEIAAAVKAHADSQTRVLMLTGDLRPASVRQALAAGADGYVHKSEESGELLQAVQAVLAGRQYVSKSIAAVFQPQPIRTPGGSGATPREKETMSLVARGLNNREISELLKISVLTVRTHRQNLMEKFSLRNAAEITAYAVQQGYYDPS
jgi:DNA-binding NarL/FixJ family response regulator